MKRLNFLVGLLAVGMVLAIAPGNASAHRRLGNGPWLVTLDGFGNGTATDDRSGLGCQDPNYPNLACPSGDYCACITGTAAFNGIGRLPGTLTTEISLDFSNDNALYGTPNGSGGYCFGATGVGTATASNGDSMFITLQGNVCDTIPVGTSPDLIYGGSFNGNYTLVGGTGHFTGQTGTGSFTESVSDVNTPDAPTTFTAVGSTGH